MTQTEFENKLTMPKSLGIRDPSALFALCTKVKQTEGDIVFDASQLVFIDPLGLAVLGALLQPVSDRNISILWLGVDVASYMERMNFFSQCPILGVEIPDNARNDKSLSLVELTCVTSSIEIDVVADRLATALTGHLTHADPAEDIDMESGGNQYSRFKDPLNYALSELMENSLTHARRNDHRNSAVWVAAQYYGKNKNVRMAVVDNGCGMLSTLKNHAELTEQTHAAAILASLKPRVSCNRDGGLTDDQGNQGVGLTTSSKIAGSASGGLIITSGDGHIGTGSFCNQAPLQGDGYWNGVAISFSCQRHKLPAIRIPELLPPAIPSDYPITFN
jgi:hypothetical protein